jgi:hypothetical protein
MNSKKKAFIGVLSLFSIIIFFQNCGKKSFNTKNAAELNTGVFYDECLKQTNNETCLIYKNPAVGMQFIQKVPNDQITTIGKLSLPDFDVLNFETNQVQVFQNEPIPFSSQNPFPYAYIHTSYWAKEYSLFIKKIIQKPWALDQKSVKIYANSPFSGWSPDKNEIHLFFDDFKNQVMALDASVLVYFLSEAQLSYLTSKKIDGYQADTKTYEKDPHLKNCKTSKGKLLIDSCCNSQNGCSKAISSGQADYLTSLFFQTHPAVGDDWGSDLNGFQACGIYRNPELNQKLTFNQAFEKCSQSNIEGYFPILGAVYASLWWEMRKEADVKENIDFLFLAHLESLNFDDTFTSALEKAIEKDRTLFANKYTALIKRWAINKGLLLN